MPTLESNVPKVSSRVPIRSWVLIAIAVVILVIYVITVAFMYFSPEHSWNDSIRDHDGDGVVDSEDSAPYNSSIWTYGSATVIVVVHSDNGYGSVLFAVSQNGIGSGGGTLYHETTETVTITPSWLRGTAVYESAVYNYTATSYYPDWNSPLRTDSELLTVSNGQIYTIELYV